MIFLRGLVSGRSGRWLFMWIWVAWSASLWGQGTIRNAEGESLSFVSILLNDDPTLGILSNIEGRFSLPQDTAWKSITLSYVGYERRRFTREELGPPPWDIVMEPARLVLPLVTVVAGENPAHRIIRQAAVRRNAHDPDGYPQYVCTLYNQVILDPIFNQSELDKRLSGMDSTSQARYILRRDSLIDQYSRQHGIVMESVVERRYKRPGQTQDVLLKNHFSGLQEGQIPALANQMQPFSFHGDYIEVLTTSYLNPVSRGSISSYNFRIEDTLYVGRDTVWVISFRPMPGATFDGLEGVLHIHGADYAIRNVRARPAGKKRIEMIIEQQYQKLTDGRWFPEQLRFELIMPEYPDKTVGLFVRGLTWVRSVETEVRLRRTDFDPDKPLYAEADAFVRSDSFMNLYRPGGALNDMEARTYIFVDSLFNEEGIDVLFNLLQALGMGVVRVHPQSPVHLDIRQLMTFNAVEGYRLNLGLTTREPNLLLIQKHPVDSRIWAGYGFRDKNWKYGAELRVRMHRPTQTRLEIVARQELTDPGSLYEIEYPQSTFSRRFFTSRMDLTREVGAGFRSMPIYGLELRVDAVVQDLKPLYDYSWHGEGDQAGDHFYLQEWRAGFRWRQIRNTRQSSALEPATRLPIVEMYMTQSVPAFGNSTPFYRRYVATIHQRIPVRKLGSLRWRIEGGLLEGDAPLARLFTVIRPEDPSFNLIYVRHFFQTADSYFLMDRFGQVMLSQELGYLLWHHKYSKPMVQLTHQSILGTLRYPDRHREIEFRTPDRGFHESGVILHHLLRINYVNIADLTLGAGAFVPYGHGVAKSFHRTGLRLTLNFQF